MGFVVLGELIVAIVGVVLVSRRMRSQVARWCFRLGVSFLLAVFALFGGAVQAWVSDTDVGVGSSDDAWIRIEVPHSRMSASGSSYLFHPMVDTQTLLAAMKEQYPDTIITGQSAHLVKDNWGYTLYPEEGIINAYTLEAEILVVSQDSYYMYLPFPRRSLNNPNPENWTSGQPSKSAWTVVSTCDYECMAEYYRPFTNVTQTADRAFNVKVANNTFQLRPTHDGYTIAKL